MKSIVTKEVLDIYDKYDGDLGLLDKPWASKKDHERISSEQAEILSEYIDKTHFITVQNISENLKNETLDKISELETNIHSQVISIIKRTSFSLSLVTALQRSNPYLSYRQPHMHSHAGAWERVARPMRIA